MSASSGIKPFACAEWISSRRYPCVHRPFLAVRLGRKRPGHHSGDDLADHQRRDQRESGDQELPIALHGVVVVVRVHPRQANSTGRTSVFTLSK